MGSISEPLKILIVGAGIAGLSSAYHMLDLLGRDINIVFLEARNVSVSEEAVHHQIFFSALEDVLRPCTLLE